MRYPSRLVEGTLIRRYKRFLCDVELPDGRAFTAHLANTGSMRNCLEDGAAVRLWDSGNPKRKLPWSVEQIRVGGHWIGVNTARPNAVVAEAIEAGLVPELAGYQNLRREVQLGESRIDLCLDDPARCWVEVKNVTLLRSGVLSFPDAVTTRGSKHVNELADAVLAGDRAVLFLHIGHEGGERVTVARDIDPVWAAALGRALDLGVEVLAYRARMDVDGLWLDRLVPFSM